MPGGPSINPVNVPMYSIYGKVKNVVDKANFIKSSLFTSIGMFLKYSAKLAQIARFLDKFKVIKPAVTFKIPGSGVNYVCLNNENGIEVENRNVHAYAEAMRKLADDVHIRTKMGLAAKKRIEENFLTSQFTENISELIKSL